MEKWDISALTSSHERGSFCSGNERLDRFFKSLAGQYEKRRLGRTHVATRPGDTKVVGFYTSATGSMDFTSLPHSTRKRLPKHPLPTVHLGRLAVDRSCQGKGLGATLLFHFFESALEISKRAGVFAVDVWATDEKACDFYRRFGFDTLDDDPFHLFLPITTVERVLAE